MRHSPNAKLDLALVDHVVMPKVVRRMMTEPDQRPTRWPLAVWEAFLMLWLLMVCWFVFGVTLRHPEIFGGDPVPEGAHPALSRLALQLLPQHAIAILLSLPGAALGFAAVTLVSRESLSSRLFRWLIVLIATGVFAAFLPLADRVMLLGREIDSAAFDWSEVLAAAAGVAVAFTGVWHARRNWR